MKSRVILIIMVVMFITLHGQTQRQQRFIDPMPARTAETDAEALRLMRNEKLDLILPGAMRDNNVDMWIHVIRAGNSDTMAIHFGSASGYLIYTDRGEDRIEWE